MHILLIFHNQSAIPLINSVVSDILTKLIADVLQNLINLAMQVYHLMLTIHVYTCLTGFKLLH